VTGLDRLLQRWRVAKVARFVAPGASVLDVGCGDAAFHRLVPHLGAYVGIDPAAEAVTRPGFRLVRGVFPDDCPDLGPVDAVVMLATLEHVPAAELPAFVRRCAAVLRPAGRMVLTVPHPRVDAILHLLVRLGLVDDEEMKVHEHSGFDTSRTAGIFEAGGFRLLRHDVFQLGLNNLFVFEKV
jgi:2-polyprenyl-3-methyl-5-hydroxy-6-metoxy-1,4-benzoquinol methylase